MLPYSSALNSAEPQSHLPVRQTMDEVIPANSNREIPAPVRQTMDEFVPVKYDRYLAMWPRRQSKKNESSIDRHDRSACFYNIVYEPNLCEPTLYAGSQGSSRSTNWGATALKCTTFLKVAFDRLHYSAHYSAKPVKSYPASYYDQSICAPKEICCNGIAICARGFSILCCFVCTSPTVICTGLSCIAGCCTDLVGCD
jgi:hypothetical protein